MTDKILEVRGLTKTYGGVKKRGAKKADPTLDVLKGIDLDIYRGDVVCLIGPYSSSLPPMRQVRLSALPEPVGDPFLRLYQV